jgi:hypothetical protein
MPAGYTYLKTGDFRLNQEHPPLIKLLSAIGLLAVKPELPLDSPGWQKAADPGDPEDGSSEFAEAFFTRNATHFDAIAFWGRLPMLAVAIALAVTVWWFARSLFGDFAGLLAPVLLLTEPNFIGNATLVQDDLGAALALLGFVLSIRSYLKGPSVRRGAIAGAVCGLAMLTKHSLVILAPACLLILVFDGIRRAVRKQQVLTRPELPVIAAAACSYLVLIAGYAFHVEWIDEDEAAMIAAWLHLSGGPGEAFQSLLLHLPLMLPKYFMYGLDMVRQDVQEGRPAFLLGQVSSKGWWYYFPVAFVLKTTVPFLVLTLGGLLSVVVRIVRNRWSEGLYVVLPPLVYLGLSMMSHLNIGVRHVLPIFPFFAVAAAGGLASLSDRLRLGRFAVRDILAAATVIVVMTLAVITYPGYMTYFSPLAGGTARGWTRLSDSNVETGQEAKTLAAFLKARGETSVEGIFIGDGFMRFYGIALCRLPCEPDSSRSKDPPKYAAIGPWYLQEVDVEPEERAAIEPFRQRQPETMIGNSIFLYRIR